jgi:hypothetical protein
VCSKWGHGGPHSSDKSDSQTTKFKGCSTRQVAELLKASVGSPQYSLQRKIWLVRSTLYVATRRRLLSPNRPRLEAGFAGEQTSLQSPFRKRDANLPDSLFLASIEDYKKPQEHSRYGILKSYVALRAGNMPQGRSETVIQTNYSQSAY